MVALAELYGGFVQDCEHGGVSIGYSEPRSTTSYIARLPTTVHYADDVTHRITGRIGNIERDISCCIIRDQLADNGCYIIYINNAAFGIPPQAESFTARYFGIVFIGKG